MWHIWQSSGDCIKKNIQKFLPMTFSVCGVFAILDYGSLSLTLPGHLRVVFDFGFERQELIFPGKHFGLGQYHDVRITRKDSGSKLIMMVRKAYLNLRFK